MHDVLPHIAKTDFPPIRRRELDTLQINLGYRCNLSCLHCHVAASPRRKEQMNRETVNLVLRFLKLSGAGAIDLTGGAPEMNANFRYLVASAREMGVRVIDRCNLTILEEPGYEDLAEFLADQQVDIVASLPCYLEENVDAQRGDGVFDSSIRMLQRLNSLGYGKADSGLELDLIYNPQGATLPPAQNELEADYKRILDERYGIRFNALYALANLPVGRFGSTLISKGKLQEYVSLLRDAHQPENLKSVMCLNQLSVDWQGHVYDCDFNQMLGVPLRYNGSSRPHLSELLDAKLLGLPIQVYNHCYGCTAGQGSSCGGALT